MINIPREHENCGKVRRALFERKEGFTERIENLSGLKVSTYGDQAKHYGKRPPSYVGVVGGGTVPRAIVEVAWYGSQIATQERRDRVMDLMQRCPGSVNIVLDPNKDPFPITVCGLIAQAIDMGNTSEEVI